jgi:hypothetical protein
VLELAHFVERMWLPATGVGLIVGILSRFVGTRRSRSTLHGIAGVLFFVPQVVVLFLGTYSASLRMHQQALLSLWGLGLGVVIMVQLITVPRLSRFGNHFILALGATAMMVLGIYCGRNIIGDYVLKHDTISGRVDGVIENPPLPGSYQIIINHKAYNITFDLLRPLTSGDYVYAEVGVASNIILSVRR